MGNCSSVELSCSGHDDGPAADVRAGRLLRGRTDRATLSGTFADDRPLYERHDNRGAMSHWNRVVTAAFVSVARTVAAGRAGAQLLSQDALTDAVAIGRRCETERSRHRRCRHAALDDARSRRAV